VHHGHLSFKRWATSVLQAASTTPLPIMKPAPPLGVAHSLAVLAEVAQGLAEPLQARMLALQVRERVDDGLGPVVFVEEPLSQDSNLRRVPNVPSPKMAASGAARCSLA
jgi:hypothetical protein